MASRDTPRAAGRESQVTYATSSPAALRASPTVVGTAGTSSPRPTEKPISPKCLLWIRISVRPRIARRVCGVIAASGTTVTVTPLRRARLTSWRSFAITEGQRMAHLADRHAGEPLVREGIGKVCCLRPAPGQAIRLRLVGRQALAQRRIESGEAWLERDLAPHRGGDTAAWLECAMHLADGRRPVGEELQALLACDNVEASILDRKRCGGRNKIFDCGCAR